ncbi:MAG: selenocysteine-specific translation elongation factor, partial [Planctomycetota bacterium]
MTQKQACPINITLGTAGHIDHGKTALIKLLTGCETDRLKQEKERGMSIELGFAPCRLGDLEVGIVDVPGHENFIKTMVAGATGIDGVIFVVAADDGIMPQTREHLDILTLLGVQHGMVALTKIDLVSEERVESVIGELQTFLQGTFLQAAPICPMSAITGDGFDGFYSSLKGMISGISPRSIEGIFRMPVERMFSVKGFGTVVSGIPSNGSAKTGDELILLPSGNKSRIKAIQVYGQDAEIVKSGQCAALNLPQVNYKNVQRGHVLTQGDYFKPAMWFACTLGLLELEGRTLKNGSKVKFHTGTSEVTGTTYLLESDTVTPGQETVIQIRTEQSIVAGPNDPYILRSLSPARTLGGGRVIEPMQRKIKRSHSGEVEDVQTLASAVGDPLSFIEYCIRHAVGCAAKLSDVSLRTKLHPDKVSVLVLGLIELNRVLTLMGDVYIHCESVTYITDILTQEIETFHKEKPDSPGIEKDQLLA